MLAIIGIMFALLGMTRGEVKTVRGAALIGAALGIIALVFAMIGEVTVPGTVLALAILSAIGGVASITLPA